MTPIFPQLDVNIPEGWWKQDAQLDLDFANRRAYNKSTQFRGRPDSILTYTSPSPKMVYGDDVVLRYAPHNRFLYSKDLSAASWSKIRGSATADKFSCDSTADASHSFQQNVITAGVDSVLTVELRPAEITTVFIQLGGTILRAVNLSTGALGSYSLGTSTASLVAADDGYYLLTLSGVPSNTNLLFFAGEGDGSTLDITLAGVRTGEGFYARKLQVSYGTVAFDYIPTTSAAVYALPIDHDPITHAPLGVLIEEQRTNLLLRSQEFNNTGSWAVPAGATIAADNTTAPAGTLTADKLTRTTTSGVVLGYGSGGFGLALTAGVHTLSYFAKADTQTSLTVALVTSGKALGSEVVFNLSAGTAGAVTNYGATTGSVAAIQELDGGWYRCSLTVTVTTATWFMQAEMPSAGSYWLWGAQLEAGAFATSYIPTVASQVTRAADQVSILTSAFAYNAAAGTMAFEGAARTAGTCWSIDDGTTNERLTAYDASGTPAFFVVDGGSTQALLTGAAVTNGVVYKQAAAWAANDFASSLNGAAVLTDGAGTLPTVTSLKLGQRATGIAQLNGHIKRLTYFPARKTNAELQGLTI